MYVAEREQILEAIFAPLVEPTGGREALRIVQGMAFVRGLPAVFWEILGGRDVIHLTLHELVPALDAGPVVAQREVPIVWQPSLGATIRKTREAAAGVVPSLLREGLRPDGEGSPVRRAATLGPLRTTPRVGQMLAASGVCRHRYRAALQG